MNLKILLMSWSYEKQILLLLPVDYDISQLEIVKLSYLKLDNSYKLYLCITQSKHIIHSSFQFNSSCIT